MLTAMTARKRSPLNEHIARMIGDALASGVDPVEIANSLFDEIPELVDRRNAHALVERAFDNFRRERTMVDDVDSDAPRDLYVTPVQ